MDNIDPIPSSAFLVIDDQVHPLIEAVINIGRRLENQLVVDDARVSRSHAQIRAVKGHYVLFDLNSTGGTFVNGKKVSQTVLYPGDKISFAGVLVTYHQDEPAPRRDLANTVL